MDDKFDRIGPMLRTSEQMASELVGGDANGLYLYVEVGDRWISTSVFKDEGESVRYYDQAPSYPI